MFHQIWQIFVKTFAGPAGSARPGLGLASGGPVALVKIQKYVYTSDFRVQKRIWVRLKLLVDSLVDLIIRNLCKNES
jgi:hypothetical protein